MKNIFETPELEVLKFSQEDIVTTSPVTGKDDNEIEDDGNWGIS